MNIKEGGVGFDFCVFEDYDSSADARLYEIGNYSCEPGYSYGPIIRPRAIIHYVISGKGKLYIGNKIFKVHENQIFYIPQDVSAYYEADMEDPWSYKWMHIGGDTLHDVLKEIGLSKSNPVLDIKEPYDSSFLSFDQIVQNIFDHYEHEQYCIGKMYELIDYFKSVYGAPDDTSAENQQLNYVRTVIKYIQLKYSEQIHMDDIANTCGLNRSYLSRLFHDATGKTIKGYLLSYRMKTAQNMLKATHHPISYISSAVGYNDIFTFSKAFKKFAGVTPSEYRRGD
ncbi:AraC family transcriptional regulator [Butyrivibrio sp. NC2002]|uniref:AraC family transcriptional regulator n=1 Tax=Butyrivibrio sp. NC2002 TaxID=1410610 RepID=UPI00055E8D85|nr:AraC family transcriptional regulator [Butyrivibrio sp. NC2002]